MHKKRYTPPRLEKLGTAAEMTKHRFGGWSRGSSDDGDDRYKDLSGDCLS